MIEGLRQISNDYLLKELHDIVTTINYVDQCDEQWDIAVEDLAARILLSKHFDQLQQLVIQGPVDDGDVISKAQRNFLLDIKLAVRVMYRGQWGYTTGTYLGGFVMKACFVSDEAFNNYVNSKLR